MLALLMVGALALQAGERPAGPAVVRKMLVLPIEARNGAPPNEAALLTDYLVAQARRVPSYAVISQADLEKLLSLEMKQQLMGCDAVSCLAEIGGALDADVVVFGTMGRLGEHDLVLTLSALNPRELGATRGESERLPDAGKDAALDGLTRALHRLFPDYQPPPPHVRGMQAGVLGGLLTAAGAAIQYAAFAGMFTSSLFIPCPVLAVGFFGGSMAACCGGPLYIPVLQAWLADVIGKRQVGYRYAILWGGGAMAFALVSTAFAMAGGAGMGFLLGRLGPEQFNAQRDAVNVLITLLVPLRQSPDLDFAIVGAAMALWMGVAMMVLGVPLAQVASLMLMARPRPPDEEATMPGLYGPQEDVPHFLSWLPRSLMGGRVEQVDALETPPAKATPAAPEAQPPSLPPPPSPVVDDAASSPTSPSPSP